MSILSTSSRILFSILIIVFLVFALPITSPAAQKITLVLSDSLHNIPGDIEEFGDITAICFDPDYSLYLIEESGRRLVHIDKHCAYKSQTGGFGFGKGSFNQPADITMAGFELWVCDVTGGRIVRFDRFFTPLGVFGNTLDNGGGLPFDRPVSAAYAASGDIVVIESDRDEALLIDSQGRLIDRFAGFGESIEGLDNPVKVEISQSGTIAIADKGNRAVFLFDRYGSPMGKRPYPLDGQGPLGLAWQKDLLWVCGNSGLAVMTSDGKVAAKWSYGAFGGPFNDVAARADRLAVAVGNSVRLYRVVTDDR